MIDSGTLMSRTCRAWPGAAAVAAVLLLARAAERGEAAGADAVVAVERPGDGQLALAAVVEATAAGTRGQAALAVLLVVDDRRDAAERTQRGRRPGLDRAQRGLFLGALLLLGAELVHLGRFGLLDLLAAARFLERLHPLLLGLAQHRGEPLLLRQPVGLGGRGGSATARRRRGGTGPTRRRRLRRADGGRRGRGRRCRDRGRGGSDRGRSRGRSRLGDGRLDARRDHRAFDRREHHRRRHRPRRLGRRQRTRLDGRGRYRSGGRRGDRRGGGRRSDGGLGDRRGRRRGLDDRLLARRIAGAMEDARALDLDHDRLRPAVAEALLDLADLDRLVEAERGAHAELGFVVVAHSEP